MLEEHVVLVRRASNAPEDLFLRVSWVRKKEQEPAYIALHKFVYVGAESINDLSPC